MPQLFAGYATADITPPLGVAMAGYGSRDTVSTGVNDPLQAQALYLRSGDTATAVVTVDLLWLDGETVAQARALAERACGVPGGNVMIAASHTHWGPVVTGNRYLAKYVLATVLPEYRANLIATLGGLVASAARRARPVVMGWGLGFAEGITYNRRQVGPDGRTEMHLVLDPPMARAATAEGNRLAQSWRRNEHRGPRLSPPLAAVEGKQVGVADAGVGVVRLDCCDGDAAGTPLVALTNFACHAVCGGGDFYHYSADYPGQAREAFSAITGAPLMFTAACSGDQVPRWRGDGSRERVGRSLGAESARAWLAMEDLRGDMPLACASRTIKLPLNPATPALEAARAALAAHPEPESTAACTERAMVEIAENIAAHPDGYPAEVWAMRLGEVGFVGLPGEVLTEIGMQIKQRSPLACTLPVSCANDAIGYLPTDDACREGGYEPAWSPVGPGTERLLVDTGLALLTELAEGCG